MAAFQFEAIDARGVRHRGVEEGEHPRQVRSRLRDQGLTPLVVTLVSGHAEGGRRGVRGIGTRALALMTRQLATLLRAGAPLAEALHTVATQTTKRSPRSVLLALHGQVSEGLSLAAAMRRFARVFPEDYIATVAAGEQTGHLDAVLERLADHTENRDRLRRSVVAALIYPALLTVVSVGIVIAMLVFVVPEVVQVFVGMDRPLPWLTRALIASSAFLRDWGPWGLGLGTLALMAFLRALRRPAFRSRWEHLLLRLPLVGDVLVATEVAHFTRTFGLLVSSGVPVMEAMHIAAAVLIRLPLRQSVLAAAERVREGSGVFASLQRTGRFPPMTLHLLASGESSGRLGDMLERAAQQLEQDQEAWINTAVRVLEPLLILLMGGVVLVIVLAIMLPIFDLNQLMA
ncbi:MAG: type II secretion system inner membrane protein GspF [Candidatus Macondimonas sp.]